MEFDTGPKPKPLARYRPDPEVEEMLKVSTEDEKRLELVEKIARHSAELQRKGDLGFEKREPSEKIAADLARVAFEKDQKIQGLTESDWELYKKTFLKYYAG